MSSNDRKFGVTFLWSIENFDEYFKGNLVSPVFLSNSLNDTEWQISLWSSNDEDYTLTLTRCGSDKGIKRIILDCELSIVDKLGSSLECRYTKNHGFVRFHSLSCKKFVLQDVFVSKKSEFLHLNILTVRCRLWRRFDENTQPELRCCRSRIERSCFIWSITDFCSLKAYEKKTIHVTMAHSEIPILTFEFFETENEEAVIEVSPSAEMPVFDFWCTISALDSMGKLITKEGEGTFVYEVNDWNVFNIPVAEFKFHVKKSTLLGNKSLFLPMDVLSLRVEIFFWINETRNLDQSQYIPIQNFQVSEKLLGTQKNDDQCKAENLSCTQICDKQYGTEKFFLDMQGMFEEGFHSDFSLCADNKTFRVHKNILSARSPVFKAMFTTAMEGEEGNNINISDVDADTLQRMLLFMYSNKIEDLNWESALNLYFAAYKYGIADLKEATCSSLKSGLSAANWESALNLYFGAYKLYDIDDLRQAICSSLKSGLSASNACEVLRRAHLHEDQDLKSTALEFIMSNDKEIIGTKDWKILQKNHINLAVEIFSDLYTKNMKN